MKRIIALLLCAVMAVSLCACAGSPFGVVDRDKIGGLFDETQATTVSSNNGNPEYIWQGKEDEKTTRISDKDYTYHPSADSVTFDKEKNVIYFNNLLIAYTVDNLSDSEAMELAKSVDGIVAGKISGSINAVQIKVKSTDLNGLNHGAEVLMKSEDVLFAGYDYPIDISSNNTWSSDKNKPEGDLGNESKPEGNDWWAEAVGAYTAWKNSSATEKIKVGIIDDGFDTDHEDLKGKITFLDDYKENSEADHGTHVAGIIAANNNKVGIRGIADGAELVGVDWSPVTNDNKSDAYVNYLSTGEYMEIINRLAESGVKVINNSWGTYVFSKEGYTQALYGDSDDYKFLLQYFAVHCTGAYDSYLELINARAKRTSLEAMMVIIQLMLNEKEDFLIVQSAGNGYDNGGKGFDVSKNGFFCSIDENSFNLLSESTRELLAESGITYSSIDDRVMIVGAVKNEKDKNKNYLMTDFSNFGKNIDICAPGEAVYSTVTNDEYKNADGTSMAAPIVAGSAALLWAFEPELKAGEVKDILIKFSTANAVGVGDGKGEKYPVVNIGNAIMQSRITEPTHFESDKYLVEVDGVIYYVDKSGLWRNTGSSKSELLHKCKATNIASDGKVIYYSVYNKESTAYCEEYGRDTAWHQYDLYCYDLEAKTNKKLTSFVECGRAVCAYNSKLYYTDFPADFTGYRTGKAQSLYSYDLKTGAKEFVANGANIVMSYDNRIFYRDIDPVRGDSAVNCYNMESGKTQQITDDTVCDFRIYNDKLYYLSAAGADSQKTKVKFFEYNLADKSSKELFSTTAGDMVTMDYFGDNYLYYNDVSDSGGSYRVNLKTKKSDRIKGADVIGKTGDTAICCVYAEGSYTDVMLGELKDTKSDVTLYSKVYKDFGTFLAIKNNRLYVCDRNSGDFYFYDIEMLNFDRSAKVEPKPEPTTAPKPTPAAPDPVPQTQPPKTPRADIPEDAFEFNGHKYKVYKDVCKTWEEAEEYCKNLGGHLAVISSKEENDALYSYITSNGITNAYFGFTDNQSEGNWKWVEGESGYTNWHTSEPNNESNTEDYAMFYWKYSDGTWNDGNFGKSTVSDDKNFLCEWE